MQDSDRDNKLERILENESRVAKGAGMLPTAGLVTGPQRAATIQSLREFKKETGYTDAQLSKISGVNKTYVNNVLSGKVSEIPFNSQDEVFRNLQCAIDRERRAIAARRPKGFVYTKPAKMIINGVRKATTVHSWFVFTGPSGIGKSFTVDVLQAEIPTVVTLRIANNNRTPTNFLRSLHIALRAVAGRADGRFDDIVAHMRKPAGVASHMVLVIDEAHQLARKTWDVCRDLFDIAQRSLVFIGTGELEKQAFADDTPDLGQIASRIGLRVNLAAGLGRNGKPGDGDLGAKLFTVEDVRKLFYEDGLRLHPNAAEELLDIANNRRDAERGALRRAGWVFHFAVAAAREEGVSEITTGHIAEAIDYIKRGRRVKRVAAEDNAEAAARAAAVG